MRELVTVGRFDAEVKARLAKLALEEAGIRAWLENEHLADWGLGVLVRVNQEDEAAARKVLSDRSPVEYPDDEEEVFDSLDGRGDRAAAREEPTLREQEAQRALTTAAVAWLLCPLHPLATALLLKVLFLRQQRLAEPYRRKAWLAAAINAPFVLGTLLFAGAVFFSSQADGPSYHVDQGPQQPFVDPLDHLRSGMRRDLPE